MLLHGLSTLCPSDTFRYILCSHSLSSSETVERAKSYKTGLRVDWNLSEEPAEKDHCHPEQNLPGLLDQLLPILASVATITIKGKRDEDARPNARPEDPKNWKEGTVEGFFLDTHALHRDAIFPTDIATFPG